MCRYVMNRFSTSNIDYYIYYIYILIKVNIAHRLGTAGVQVGGRYVISRNRANTIRSSKFQLLQGLPPYTDFDRTQILSSKE